MTDMANKLKKLLERAHAWPEEAQEEIVHAGLEIEAEYVQARTTSDDEQKAAARGPAWARLERLFARMRTLNPQLQTRTTEEIKREEEEIAEDIRAMRRQRHA